MSISKFGIYLLFFIFSKTGFANNRIPIIDTSFIKSQVKSLVVDTSVLRLETDFFESLLIVSDSLAYLNPVGTLHLFELKFSDTVSVKKLSSSIYHGFNFNRNFFEYDSVLYSVGGNGLFNHYPGIIYFDFEAGEWFEKVIPTFPNNIVGIVNSWRYQHNLYMVFEVNPNPNASTIIESKGKRFSFGVLDLSSFRFEKKSVIHNIASEQLVHLPWRKIFIGERYNVLQEKLHVGGCLYSLFDKKNASVIKTSFTQKMGLINGMSFIYTDNSYLYTRNDKGKIDSVVVSKSNIFDTKEYLPLLESSDGDESRLVNGGLLIAFLAISFLGIGYYRKKKVKVFVKDELTLLEEELFEKNGLTISREDLDNLLNISHMSFESIKVRRSQLISSLNQRGRIKISRIRDVQDKRMFLYQISRA